MQHLMLDIETLDTQNSSIVLSVGGCVFNPTAMDKTTKDNLLFFGESIYLELNTYQQGAVGRTISLDTLFFWSRQEPGLEQFTCPHNDIKDDLQALSSFISHNSITYAWSKSPSFDLCILQSLFSDFDLSFPIDFRKWCDVRTIELVRGMIQLPNIGFEGIKHNAMADARHQARVVTDTLCQIGVPF